MANACVIGTGRLSFPHLLEPQYDETKKDAKGTYTTDLLIPKDAVLVRPSLGNLTLKQMTSSIKGMMAEEAKKKWKGKVPAAVRKYIENEEWLKDGDEKYEDDPETNWMFQNCWILRAKHWERRNGKLPFAIVGENPTVEVYDEDEVYGGRYANIQISAWAYDKKKEYGNQGVSFIIRNIQVVSVNGDKGEPFGGGAYVSSEGVFDNVAANDPAYYEDDNGEDENVGESLFD